MKIEEIGGTAGTVWRCLHDTGPQSMNFLKRKLKTDEKCLYLALGWLAREGKIAFRQQNRVVTVGLK